jgi:hypothetical protein
MREKVNKIWRACAFRWIRLWSYQEMVRQAMPTGEFK